MEQKPRWPSATRTEYGYQLVILIAKVRLLLWPRPRYEGNCLSLQSDLSEPHVPLMDGYEYTSEMHHYAHRTGWCFTFNPSERSLLWEWVHTCVDQIETQRDWGWKNRKWSDVIDEGQREKATLRSAQILAIWHCSSFQESCAQLLQCVQRSEIRQSARPLDSVPETSQSTIACGSFSCETVLKICHISCA